MKHSGSSNAQFIKRIPADTKAQLIGGELLVSLGADIKPVVVKIGPNSQNIRFSPRQLSTF